MASGNTHEFDCQVKACEKFFQEQLPKVQNLKPLAEDDIPKNAKLFKDPKIYDITSFDAREVVAVLSCIVNDRDQFKMNKTFYLLLRNGPENKPDEIEELFRLRARPTKHQPGNAIVFLRPTGKKKFTEPAKKYEELNGALKAYYKEDTAEDTASFARDIRKLFKNNAVANNNFPQAMFEAYMMLLFEIARRLVELEDPSDKKVQYDVLPIGSAIARIVKLLELGRTDICTFEDVFFPTSKFHCFTGEPEERRKAIDKINETTLEIAKKKNMETYGASVLWLGGAAIDPAKVFAMQVPKQDSVAIDPAKVSTTQVKCHLEELKEMFCSEKQPEAMLRRKEDSAEAMLQRGLEDLSISMSVADSMALSMKTKKSAVNTERYTGYDHA